jgi:hypothetical protein
MVWKNHDNGLVNTSLWFFYTINTYSLLPAERKLKGILSGFRFVSQLFATKLKAERGASSLKIGCALFHERMHPLSFKVKISMYLCIYEIRKRIALTSNPFVFVQVWYIYCCTN